MLTALAFPSVYPPHLMVQFSGIQRTQNTSISFVYRSRMAVFALVKRREWAQKCGNPVKSITPGQPLRALRHPVRACSRDATFKLAGAVETYKYHVDVSLANA
ncbi:hypothetical protein GSI_04882 [Ganoderma sinense ZZ0214-1]|uniref:Uncharacterized protein n=1 Tax=Ganoderma sinense ZZ0214-1 TaxID=1077348 RepID=A0A2G8SG72_9APHY|nr:hypothetical protein GSI_04882 [Ganoderma sinense ZZ0214-1]